MRRAIIGFVALAGSVTGLAGCTKTGGLQLDLELPTDSDLRPTGMTSISVVASSPDFGTQTNTSLLDGMSFSAGDLPVGSDVEIDVLFHDDSNRLVGVGEAASLVNIAADKTTALSIPVRKPFVYASSGTTLYTFDPTLDARDTSFQSTLGGVTAPLFVVSVGGDRLVVASAMSLQIVETDTNMVSGQPIAIPGTISDAAPVPGTHMLAVAHTTGISIVDLDSGDVTTVGGAAVDRVTVGPDSTGAMIATGLVGRIAPPASTEACTGTSTLVTTPIASPPAMLSSLSVKTPVAISDVAASPDSNALFAALSCDDEVGKFDGAQFQSVSSLTRAAVLTVADEHVFAAGTAPADAQCAQGTSTTTVDCPTGATASCPDASSAIVYVDDGAHLIIQSIPVDGSGSAVSIDFPEPRETIVSTDDPGRQHAQVLKSLALTPVDLVTLPGGEYVGVVLQTRYFIQSLVGETGEGGEEVILPCLDLTTGDWQLIDMANTSVAERVRTDCNLTIGPTDANTLFKNWQCDDAPDGQAPTQGTYMPISVGALFGAR